MIHECLYKYDQAHYAYMSVQHIEDIQMFLLNMAFILTSELENIHIYISIF